MAIRTTHTSRPRRKSGIAAIVFTGLVALGLAWLAHTLTAAAPPKPPVDLKLIIDNSDSRFLASGWMNIVVERFERWLENAAPGSVFEVLVLEEKDSPQVVRTVWRLTVPTFPPNVTKNRRLFRDRSLAVLETIVRSKIDTVQWTPLAEAGWEVMDQSSASGHQYALLFVTDTLQSSRTITFTRNTLASAPDRVLVQRMLNACPAVAHPPLAATIITTAGSTGDPTGFPPRLQKRVEGILRALLRAWGVQNDHIEFIPV